VQYFKIEPFSLMVTVHLAAKFEPNLYNSKDRRWFKIQTQGALRIGFGSILFERKLD
jgi:hypothetical protein